MCLRLACFVVSLSAVGLLSSEADAANGEIKGYMFGDYYYVVSADDGEESFPEKRNAFQFRRIYFTYDKALSDRFSMRWRLEANDAGFGDGDKMQPFVKNAYLKWGKAVAAADLYIGLTGTPTWATAEKFWGYRPIEQTVMNLNGLGSPVDLGVALKGTSGELAYHLMVGNGRGTRPEDDNGKKIYGQLSYNPSEVVSLVGYADFSMRPADEDQMTFAGLAGVESETFHGAVEVFARINRQVGQLEQAGDEVTIAGASVYAAARLADQLKGFGRVDVVDNNDEETTDLLLIAGLDHSPAKDVHLMPNLLVEIPDGPDPTIQGRLTFFYKF